MADPLEMSLIVPPHVLGREVGDELVLMNLSSDAFYGLDGVGRRMWSLLEGGLTVRSTIETISGEYDEPRSVVEADVMALVQDLLKEGLLLPATKAGG